MIILPKEQFDRLVEEAWGKIPRDFRDKMENVLVAIEDEPTQEQLRRLKTTGTLLGLFEGFPETAWGQAVMGVQPSKITLFQGPITRCCSSLDRLKKIVQKVLMHEVGHYFGYNDQQMFILDRKLMKKLENEDL